MRHGVCRSRRCRPPAGRADYCTCATNQVVVLGLPRGGVPVAFEIAAALDAPLDVIVVRKLGVPFQPEFGMGAIGEDGARIVDEQVVRLAGVSDRDLAEVECTRARRTAAPGAEVPWRPASRAAGRPNRRGGRRRHRHRGDGTRCLPGRPRPRRAPGRARRAGGASRLDRAHR